MSEFVLQKKVCPRLRKEGAPTFKLGRRKGDCLLRE